jgi:hypothetical protein
VIAPSASPLCHRSSAALTSASNGFDSARILAAQRTGGELPAAREPTTARPAAGRVMTAFRPADGHASPHGT